MYVESLDQEKKEFFENLLNTIIKIDDLDGNQITFKTLCVKRVKLRSSITFSNLLFIDDKPCSSKKRSYKITYKCICGNISTILLQKFLQKSKISCSKCCQLKEYGGIGHNNPNRPHKQCVCPKILNFNNESNEFKNLYFQKHLTPDEFYNWLPKIYQINDFVLTNKIRNEIIFLPHEQCNNQSKYTNMISLNNKKYSIKEIYIKCDICGNIQRIHIINLRNKNYNYLKCKQCALTNTSFPIQKYLNTNLTFQSSIEKEFLDLCFQNNIKVENGLKIPYYWNNKNHKYISDFYLPTYKIIIELKSNTIFYKQQKASGKQDAKNAAAEEYAKNNNMKFIFLFDNQIKEFFNNLLN